MIKLTAEVEGLEGAFELLNELNALMGPKGITGAELKSVSRNEGKATNAEIAGWLAEDGRDFFGPSQEDADIIAAMVVNVIEQRTQALATKLERRKTQLGKGKISRLTGKSVSDIETQWAKATGAAALRAAMREWMLRIDDRITGQVAANGGGIEGLSEDYAAKKRRRFGFDVPVGVATGQLRDNFGASIASGNIRITRTRQEGGLAAGDRLMSRLMVRSRIGAARQSIRQSAAKRRKR